MNFRRGAEAVSYQFELENLLSTITVKYCIIGAMLDSGTILFILINWVLSQILKFNDLVSENFTH